jgi:hypothetical protein
MNAETGQILWSKSIFTFWWLYFQLTSPVCANNKVYVTDFDLYSYKGYVKCFDGATGSSAWTYQLGPALSFATPAVSNNGVYITAFDMYSYFSWMYRIDATTGQLIWRKPLPVSSYFGFGSPICSADKIVLAPGASYGYSNELYCFEKENGTLIWNAILDSNILGGPSIGDERLYVADYQGGIYAFEDVMKIKNVLGGLLGINAIIQNTGPTSLTNVSWNISVMGGSQGMIKLSRSGTIQELRAGGLKIVRLIPVIGIGPIAVLVKATMPGMNTIKKQRQGLVFGSICLMLS